MMAHGIVFVHVCSLLFIVGGHTMRCWLLLVGNLAMLAFSVIGFVTVCVCVAGYLTVPELPNITGKIYDCRRLGAFEAWQVYTAVCQPHYEPAVDIYCYPHKATLLSINSGSHKVNLLLPPAIIKIHAGLGEVPTVRPTPPQLAQRY